MEDKTKYLSWEVPPEQKFGTLTSFLKLQVAKLLPGQPGTIIVTCWWEMRNLAGDDFPVSRTEGAPCRGSQKLRVDRASKRNIVTLDKRHHKLIKSHTPRKTNIFSEKWWLEDSFFLKWLPFEGRVRSFSVEWVPSAAHPEAIVGALLPLALGLYAFVPDSPNMAMWAMPQLGGGHTLEGLWSLKFWSLFCYEWSYTNLEHSNDVLAKLFAPVYMVAKSIPVDESSNHRQQHPGFFELKEHCALSFLPEEL